MDYKNIIKGLTDNKKRALEVHISKEIDLAYNRGKVDATRETTELVNKKFRSENLSMEVRTRVLSALGQIAECAAKVVLSTDRNL